MKPECFDAEGAEPAAARTALLPDALARFYRMCGD